MLECRGELIPNCGWKARNQDAFENAACHVSIFMLDCVENGGMQTVFSAFTI